MREYINITTGEVITRRTILGAWAYYRKDARRFGYAFKMRDIITIKAYHKGLK